MSTELVPVDSNGASTPRRGGVTGRGFVPGKSGNPGGRAKGGPAALAQRIRRETKDGRVVVDYLLEAMQRSRSGKERIDAATLLLAYGFGKPVQPTELTGAEGGAMVFRIVYEDRVIADFTGDGLDAGDG